MEKGKRRKSQDKLYFSEKERAELRSTIPARTGKSNLEGCDEIALMVEEDPEAAKGNLAGLCYEKYTQLLGIKGYRLSEAQADEFQLFFAKVMRTIGKCIKEGDVNADAVWDFLLYGGKAPWDKAQSGKKK